MAHRYYQTSDATLYEKVANEVLIVQVDTGVAYYLNGETKSFLDYFKKPQRLDAYLEGAEPDTRTQLENFSRFMLDKGFLTAVDSGNAAKASPPKKYPRPLVLRPAERPKESLALLWWTATS